MAICLLAFLLAISVKSQSCTSSIDSLKNGVKNALPLLAGTPFQDTSFSFENYTIFNDKTLPKHVSSWQPLGNLTNSTLFRFYGILQPKQVV